VDRLLLKTMTVDSPKAQLSSGEAALWPTRCGQRLPPTRAKNIAPFLLGVFQNSLLFFRQILLAGR
jgi:hypothetical protein